MQKIEIIKQNFYLDPNSVELLFEDIKGKWPDITTDCVYESSASNLQLFLYKCGLHTRIQLEGSVYTLSCINKTVEYDIDYPTLFVYLSTYLGSDRYIEVKIDDKGFEFNTMHSVVDYYENSLGKLSNTDISQEDINEAIDMSNEILSVEDISEEEGVLVEEKEEIPKKRGRPKKK